MKSIKTPNIMPEVKINKAASKGKRSLKYSKEEMQKLAKEHATSGLTLEVFCKMHGIGVSTLNRVRKEMGLTNQNHPMSKKSRGEVSEEQKQAGVPASATFLEINLESKEVSKNPKVLDPQKISTAEKLKYQESKTQLTITIGKATVEVGSSFCLRTFEEVMKVMVSLC